MSAHVAPLDLLPEERQQRILQRLHAQGRVLAVELAQEFAVSEDSIRRDLRELAARGLCRRIYGGALLHAPEVKPLVQRQGQDSERKQRLARKALTLLRKGQTIILDAGSTNSAIADALPVGFELTVVTNAPDIAFRLMERTDVEVLTIGGRIEHRIGAAIGAQAVQELRRVRADLCFPGTCAVDIDSGLWGNDAEESLFKRAMIESSGETAVVVMNEKFGADARFQFASLHQIDHLIVEHDALETLRRAFEKQEIAVHRADRR